MYLRKMSVSRDEKRIIVGIGANLQRSAISAKAYTCGCVRLFGARAMDKASIREVIDNVPNPSRRVGLFKTKKLLAMPLFPFKGAVMYLIGNLALAPKTLRRNISSDLVVGETRRVVAPLGAGLCGFRPPGSRSRSC